MTAEEYGQREAQSLAESCREEQWIGYVKTRVIACVREAVAAEREACARVAEFFAMPSTVVRKEDQLPGRIAKAIRERQ